MARDARSLKRLYPDEDPLHGFRAGVVPAIWIVGLLLAAAGSAVLALVSLVAAQTEDATTVQLRAWGVLGAEERWVAAHADTPDATAGCLLTERALVRWEDRAPVARQALDRGAITLERDRDGLRIHGDTEIHCPSDPGSDLRAFEQLVRGRIQPPREDWRPGPDARVAHFFE